LSDTDKSLGDMTKLMVFFGRIPETHVKSLESYPFIFFNDVKEAKVDYSVATINKAEATYFNYELDLNLDSNDQLRKRCEALELAVRQLFWKEAQITIKINGEERFKSGG